LRCALTCSTASVIVRSIACGHRRSSLQPAERNPDMKRAVSAVFSLGCLFSAPLQAADGQPGKWPVKPVRFIVPSQAGSGDDFVARVIAPKLAELLGQPIIVDNRDGAAGLLGQRLARRASPDGYTFLLAGGSMAGARYANARVDYDVLRDFTPVSLVETSAFVLVAHPGVQATSTNELIALARAQGDKIMYGTTPAGQMPYWSAMLFNGMAGIAPKAINYKGTNEIRIETVAGRIHYFFAPSNIAVEERTRLRALGVTTIKRSVALPEVPTIAEAGLPGYDMPAWRSIMGPAGVPHHIVASLNTAIAKTLAMPDVREKLQFGGSQAAPSTPEELSKRYADWIGRFGRIAKQVGLEPQ
jgi:tripartite-type tricarboxylate transporter receptor subunit TctC